jgi:hypothetical protein
MLRKRPGNLVSLLALLVGMVAVGLSQAMPAFGAG